jgi:hypothetical protein
MPDKLTGRQFEQLSVALRDAFPGISQLRMMVRVTLGENLADFADLSNLENAIFDLIERAEARGWTEELVHAAHGRNPGNPLLTAFAEQLGYAGPPRQPAAAVVTRRDYEIIQPHNFDLVPLTREILNDFPDQGLAGFAVAFNSHRFLVNLAQRLKHEIGRDWTYCHPESLKVDTMRMPPEAVIRTIKGRASSRLPTQHVVFTVWGLNSASQTAAFWQALGDAVVSLPMEHSLIVILGMESCQDLPPEIISLPEPRFEEADLRRWIGAVINKYGWPPGTANRAWYEKVWSFAAFDDELIIELVYEHLLFAQEKLQSAQSWQQFDQALQEWSQNYA